MGRCVFATRIVRTQGNAPIRPEVPQRRLVPSLVMQSTCIGFSAVGAMACLARPCSMMTNRLNTTAPVGPRCACAAPVMEHTRVGDIGGHGHRPTRRGEACLSRWPERHHYRFANAVCSYDGRATTNLREGHAPFLRINRWSCRARASPHPMCRMRVRPRQSLCRGTSRCARFRRAGESGLIMKTIVGPYPWDSGRTQGSTPTSGTVRVLTPRLFPCRWYGATGMTVPSTVG